jgi:hypothetical protein
MTRFVNCSNSIRIACIAGLLAAPAVAHVRVVGAGGPFTDIQPAVDAAVDGDLILVRGGSYSGFSILNKELVVAADGAAMVIVNGSVDVANLAGGRTVVLAGLHVIAPFSSTALRLAGNQGPVRVIDGVYEGGSGGRPGVELYYSFGVAFSRTIMRGGVGRTGTAPCSGCPVIPAGPGGEGMLNASTPVALYGATLIGGVGGSHLWYGAAGATGGHAYNSTFGSLFASGTHFTGQVGGSGGPPHPSGIPGGCGGAGGDGVHLESTPASAELLDVTAVGGLPGPSQDPSCSPPSGVGIQGTNVILTPGSAREFVLDYPIRELQPVPVTVHGVPGDRAYAALTPQTGFQHQYVFHGVLLISGPILRFKLLGTLPPSGTLQTSLLFPELGPGVQNVTWHAQGVFIDTGAGRNLADYRVVAVMDAAF